jgi:REP element-mobilizing transposase RayT
MLQQSPQPLYLAAGLRAAYELRYGWTGWPSGTLFPVGVIRRVLPGIAPEWEGDGIRLLESSLAPEELLLTFSGQPHVSPMTLASRVKGRLDNHCRHAGTPVAFSRKVAVWSIGHNQRDQVEAYIGRQAEKEAATDIRFRALLRQLCTVRPQVDLSQPTESRSGRYWYNLHLTLVTQDRYRVGDEATLRKIHGTCLRIAEKKGYAISALAVMPDHLHLALRGAIDHAAEEVALSFLNNLAFAAGQRPLWESGYYAGTFGAYDMDAVRVFFGSPGRTE